MNIYSLLLRLYPQTWRARYEEEFLYVLTSHPFSVVESIDVMRGALDAHLHPHLGTTSMPGSERSKHLLSTLRSSLLTIFCAYVGIILAGMGFQKMSESAAMLELGQTFSLVGISFHLIVLGAISALLAVLAGGLPVAIAVVKSALTRKQYSPLFGFAIPILACAGLLAALLHIKTLTQPGQLLMVRVLFFGLPIAAATISAASICAAVAHSDISTKLLRLAFPPFILATISMALIAVGTLSWGLGLQESAPQLLAENNGLVGFSTIGTWLTIVVVMTLASGLAVLSLVRGLSARSALLQQE